MKKLVLVALPFLLLLAVAAPDGLAAENRASDPQPISLYSKLPPLQLSGSTLTQKEYLQAAIWLAQQKTNNPFSFSEQAPAQANTSAKEAGAPSDLDITKLDAKTFWPSIGVLVAAIFTFLGTMYTNRITLKKTMLEFKHQESVTSREQCKEYCIEFLNKLDILSLQDGTYDQQRIRYLVTAIIIFSPVNYSRFIVKIAAFIHSNPILIGPADRFPPEGDEKSQYDAKRAEFNTIFFFIVMYTEAMFAGKNLRKSLKDARRHFIKRGIDPQFFD